MSLSPPPRAPARRVPVQGRSERRVAAFLTQAAAVIAEVGYEATTMTEIAARAKASIGSVYQYFPNKEAIMVSLRQQYVGELAARWATLESEADRLSAEQLGEKIVGLFADFANERPAFFPLLSGTAQVRSDPAAKRRLREQFATLFQGKKSGLAKAKARQLGRVTLQTIKGLNDLCAEARPRDRPGIVAEYKLLLSAYLARRLPS